jgi:hypothetical protein
MKSLKFGYVGAVFAGALLALSCRWFLLNSETNRMRAEAYDFQQFVETQQSQIAAKRQQLQAQQEKLTKGSAIGETVGPAVLKDIVALAGKPGNVRLRELLQKHGVQGVSAVAEPAVQQPAPPAAQPARKGGN